MSIESQLKGRSCLTLFDYTTEEIRYILDLAKVIKQKHKNKEVYHPLKGKVLGMIFEKSSTRTRVSFETGIYQLGGTGLFLSSKDLQLGRGEPISDTAQVLSGYLDGIMIRTFNQSDVEALAHYGSIPVINGLTDDYHPCQVLADLQTIEEVKGKLEGLTLTYIGDGNNMAHSLMIGAVKMGMHFKTAAPAGYLPNEDIVERAQVIAKENGVTITVTTNPKEAMADTDIVYTDVWASMGQESEQKEREALFKDYQVNTELVSYAKEDYLFLHCLPAHRGEEVTTEVIDGGHSAIFQEAENRLHAQKALMVALMSD
ncbi:ornithine carbamoyltransferase [Halolactibacillus alkaliphilus]|uniref:Ornithine carbamoyltransferase n=1 Tax=Halolactibacillus alkaliphilus TaxID=442899 RepID=A0A511X0W6_9BACI|nr:ornithine carbamoyltransferase [Halolactibacillus alkaliphilus]GEN56585.1 ornithine carbamoyltransferase [Halolactibacillus alkaliphilus]GGN69631.1 ornithine carbamoyltransferase [Halolactibacillus alkaliphilus]SFO76477.1 ornithine carbamoyltransferase [Halolactibacillus alkaliphilus]